MNGVYTAIPKPFQYDIERTVSILQQGCCTAGFLFGSLARGMVNDESDIDLAVEGCPQALFFRIYGQLIMELTHPVDLIDLDIADAFVQYLKASGELQRVG